MKPKHLGRTVIPWVVFAALIAGCAAAETQDFGSRLRAAASANSDGYGYNPDDPIRLGGADAPQPSFSAAYPTPAKRAQFFFKSLIHLTGGPVLSWRNVGPCCKPGEAILSVYHLRLEQGEPVVLYVDHRRGGPLFIPAGFRWTQGPD